MPKDDPRFFSFQQEDRDKRARLLAAVRTPPGSTQNTSHVT